MKNLGDIIKKLRLEAGLSPTELANKSELSLSYISQLEGGGFKSLSLDTSKSLAKGLKLNLSDFLYSIGYLETTKNRPSFELVTNALRSAGFSIKQTDEIMRYADYIKKQSI